jgi:hypothetical protein
MKFKAQYIDKNYPDESDNVFFKKGKRKHDQLDLYTKSKAQSVIKTHQWDTDVQGCFPLIDKFHESYDKLRSELQFAVDPNFNIVDWFSKKVMYRVIVDLEAIRDKEALVVDWKTGKVRDYADKPTGQLHLTSLMEMCKEPSVDVINTAYIFIEHKQVIKRTFDRGMIDNLKQTFFTAWETVNKEKDWEPKSNQYCRFCLLETCPLK